MSIALIIPHPLHAIWATFSRREYVVILHCLKLSENYILLVEIGFRSFRMSLMVKLAPKNSRLDQYTLILRKFKGILHQKIFYRLNLIFWIVMGCGIARFGRRGLKTTET